MTNRRSQGWPGARIGAVVVALLHSIATMRSSLAPSDGAPDLLFWLTDPEADDPGFYLDPILLKPASRGRVRLRSTDPTAPPRISLPGIGDARDVERLVEGYRVGVELAASPGIRRLATEAPPSTPRSPAAWRRRLTENLYSIPHVIGTCAMGPTPADGAVVDELGRVHGVRDLRVIDASIIPEPPSGFPYLITIMVAEHLSDRLVARS